MSGPWLKALKQLEELASKGEQAQQHVLGAVWLGSSLGGFGIRRGRGLSGGENSLPALIRGA